MFVFFKQNFRYVNADIFTFLLLLRNIEQNECDLIE